ncbi:MAG: (2Fe-2S)-binding protein [Myxococcales bacterium]|nr:(2Fe-2S)-binding protein [Myxococcales bacterium]
MTEVKPATIVLDGQEVAIEEGETLLELAARRGVEIPTLCHDPRLVPAGACRTCLVEIEGWRRLAPSCTTVAADGMVVRSANERIERHRKTLMALYLTDHPAPGEIAPHIVDGSEVHRMAVECGAPDDWPRMAPIRVGREDHNAFIQFEPERCILCARCVRYCAEVEAVSAITLADRGSRTTIATADDLSLMEASCELCGGCIDVCPTDALTEKLALALPAPIPDKLERVRTTCNYCGVGCQMDLEVEREANEGRGRVRRVLSPPAGTTTNDGNLCVKGRFAYQFIEHEDRLTKPMVRREDGLLHETSWAEALETAARGLLGVKARHGSDALGFVSSSRCTGEENYLMQKLARAAFGTNNCHQCAAT